MSQPANVKCPACGRRGDWFAGQYGPFCSHRCKLVDLGKWFSGENKISEPLKPEHFAEFEELPPGKNPDAPDAEE
ncbi:MAG: DNA gyrase inhibitor YacG [Verrucomicrobia bacterium]|nr:DNA gyrase inhibitor YacG [Verrucomicrobiota bacterium]